MRLSSNLAPPAAAESRTWIPRKTGMEGEHVKSGTILCVSLVTVLVHCTESCIMLLVNDCTRTKHLWESLTIDYRPPQKEAEENPSSPHVPDNQALMRENVTSFRSSTRRPTCNTYRNDTALESGGCPGPATMAVSTTHGQAFPLHHPMDGCLATGRATSLLCHVYLQPVSGGDGRFAWSGTGLSLRGVVSQLARYDSDTHRPIDRPVAVHPRIGHDLGHSVHSSSLSSRGYKL